MKYFMNKKDMKTIIIATLILLPCLAIFNDNENFVVNILGFLYIGILFYLSKTRKGKIFVDRLYNETEKINNKIFKL